MCIICTVSVCEDNSQERCASYCYLVFFFQAEDGIRDLVRSRGLGDVYKRQILLRQARQVVPLVTTTNGRLDRATLAIANVVTKVLSLIHI